MDSFRRERLLRRVSHLGNAAAVDEEVLRRVAQRIVGRVLLALVGRRRVTSLRWHYYYLGVRSCGNIPPATRSPGQEDEFLEVEKFALLALEYASTSFGRNSLFCSERLEDGGGNQRG